MEGENSSVISGAVEECVPLLYVENSEENWIAVAENINDSSYDVANYSTLLTGTNDSALYYFPNLYLDASDQQSENLHFQDSAELILVLTLLFLTVITIWVFKSQRFRVLHETGLALCYGVAIGVIVHFVTGNGDTGEYWLAVNQDQCNRSGAAEAYLVQVGETFILKTMGGDNFTATITGKSFNTYTGDKIEASLLFDPELFFYALLPPIIFYAGYSLAKRHFFKNIGSLMLYAFAGTTVSCFLVGALMYGYVLSGIDNMISEAAAAGNISIPPSPAEFNKSIIPSLLFGSLISATDPVTVLAIFHDLHVDHDLYSLVFGESVMNDAVALVLFRSVDEYSAGGGEASEFEIAALFKSIGSFAGIFFGSFVLGCSIALLTALLMKFSKLRDYPLLETSLFFIMSYSAFVFAEMASLTGIVSILFCGIMQSYYTYINLSHESRRRTKELFEFINFMAENFVFSYMGLSLFMYNNHQFVPGFIIFSFVAIFAGRVVNIYVLSFLLNRGRSKKISFRFQHMLVFAGLRGAIAFALAIRNTESESRQLIFTTTLIIVMVTVLVCGGLTTLTLQCLKIKVGVEDDTGGLMEDGVEIPYDKSEGNWFISQFSKFDKKYLIPLFTHGGRDVTEFCPKCCHPALVICYKCRPEREELMESSGEEESSREEESEEEDDEEKVLSFRKSGIVQSHRLAETTYEGDLGLGTERRLTTDESSL